MFRRTHDRAVWPLLGGLVALAVWSNAVIWMLCPHVSGSLSRCFEQQSVTHSHETLKDPGAEHMHAMSMPNMDMQGMDMEDISTSQPKTDRILNSETENLPPVNDLMAALTQSRYPCSHCVMHSRSDANSASQTVALSSLSNENIAADSSAQVVTALPWLITVIDIHDHGPPGSGNPRYVLNSTYRI